MKEHFPRLVKKFSKKQVADDTSKILFNLAHSYMPVFLFATERCEEICVIT